MGTFSVWHWMIFLVIALLLFGGSGKISSIMGDVAKGIKSFKKGMTDDEDVATANPEGPKKLEGKPPEPHAAGTPSSTGTKVG